MLIFADKGLPIQNKAEMREHPSTLSMDEWADLFWESQIRAACRPPDQEMIFLELPDL